MDLSDPKAVKDVRLRVKIRERERAEMIVGLMSIPQGRAFVYDLLEQCGCYHQSFDRSALIMSFNEGRRSIGLFLMSLILEASPKSYLQMLEEHNDRRTPGSGPDRDRSDDGDDTGADPD